MKHLVQVVIILFFTKTAIAQTSLDGVLFDEASNKNILVHVTNDKVYLVNSIDFKPINSFIVGDSSVTNIAVNFNGDRLVLARQSVLQLFDTSNGSLLNSFSLSDNLEFDYFGFTSNERFESRSHDKFVGSRLPDINWDVYKSSQPSVLEDVITYGQGFSSSMAISTLEYINSVFPDSSAYGYSTGNSFKIIQNDSKKKQLLLLLNQWSDRSLKFIRLYYDKKSEIKKHDLFDAPRDLKYEIDNLTPANVFADNSFYLIHKTDSTTEFYKFDLSTLKQTDRLVLNGKERNILSKDGKKIYSSYRVGSENNIYSLIGSDLWTSGFKVFDIQKKEIIYQYDLNKLFHSDDFFLPEETSNFIPSKTEIQISLFKLGKLEAPDTIYFNNGDSIFITRHPGKFVVWNYIKKPISVFNSNGNLQMLGSNRFVYQSNEYQISLVDIGGGKHQKLFDLQFIGEAKNRILHWSMSPKGKYLMVIYKPLNTYNPTLEIIEVLTNKEVYRNTISMSRDQFYFNTNSIVSDSVEYDLETGWAIGTIERFYPKDEERPYQRKPKKFLGSALNTKIIVEKIIPDPSSSPFELPIYDFTLATQNMSGETVVFFKSKGDVQNPSSSIRYNFLISEKTIINLKTGDVLNDSTILWLNQNVDNRISSGLSYAVNATNLIIFNSKTLDILHTYPLPSFEQFLGINSPKNEILLIKGKDLIYYDYVQNRKFVTQLKFDRGKEILVANNLDVLVFAKDGAAYSWWPRLQKLIKLTLNQENFETGLGIGSYSMGSISRDSKYLGYNDESGSYYKFWDLNSGLEVNRNSNFKFIKPSDNFRYNEFNDDYDLVAENDIYSIYTTKPDSIEVQLKRGRKTWVREKDKHLFNLAISPEGNALIFLEDGRYDGSPKALESFYYVRGFEVIDFTQLKDRYYEPGLLKKILGLSNEPMRKSQGLNNIKLYPRINLSDPNKDNGMLAINLTNQGGGIGRVKIWINGKEASSDLRDANFNPDAETTSLTYNLNNHPYLKGNELNRIEVRAYNTEEYLASQPARVFYLHESNEITAKPKLFALIVGISDYSGTTLDLQFAAKDALQFSKALQFASEKLFGTREVTVTLLNTDSKDRWPTKENIKGAFQRISKLASPQDVMLIYLAGHGTNYGGAEGDFYFLTSDAQNGSLNDPIIREQVAISSHEFTEYLKWVPALKQVMIMDACHSGKFAEDLLARREIGSSSEIRALERMKDRTGTYILAGSASDAVSYEASMYGQGLLTYSLLFGMKGAALRENQFIDVMRLFEYAADEVPKLARNIGGIQKPEVRVPYGGGSFDIGISDEFVRTNIGLPSPKPIFLRSAFQDEETFDDPLNLSEELNQQLKGKEARSVESQVVFVDASTFTDGYSLKGRYKKIGDMYSVNVRLFKGSKLFNEFKVNGNSTNKIIDQILLNIDKLEL